MSKDAERSQITMPHRREGTGEAEQSLLLRAPRRRRRRVGLFLALALVTLAVIVVLTGLLMHFGSADPPPPGDQATVPAGPHGPFIKPPYNASQVDTLMHLVDGMTYRELANLYVAHMRWPRSWAR